MEKGGNSKLKLLYVMRFLLEKTDEEHSVTVQDIINAIKSMGLSSERKSIYEYIELLQEYGLDIICHRGKRNRYFVGSRDFELPELKLLVDAVQYSKFITQRKSDELIRKINALASEHQAKQLVRQVYVTNRLKAANENIYYSVDILHNAIAEKRKITFRYFDYNLAKQRKYRKNGLKYTAIPCVLIWDDENYYLVTYHEGYEKYVNYRVDKMVDVELTNELFEDLPEKLDVMQYCTKIFNMFSGIDEIVELECSEELIGVVIDRFGKDIELTPITTGTFKITVPIVLSPTFLAWIFQFQEKIRLVGPPNALTQYQDMLQKTLEMYK
jgi:predicted DNA-binding transcriptional regulator YafY